jgi:hypothetical protein
VQGHNYTVFKQHREALLKTFLLSHILIFEYTLIASAGRFAPGMRLDVVYVLSVYTLKTRIPHSLIGLIERYSSVVVSNR